MLAVSPAAAPAGQPARPLADDGEYVTSVGEGNGTFDRQLYGCESKERQTKKAKQAAVHGMRVDARRRQLCCGPHMAPESGWHLFKSTATSRCDRTRKQLRICRVRLGHGGRQNGCRSHVPEASSTVWCLCHKAQDATDVYTCDHFPPSDHRCKRSGVKGTQFMRIPFEE